MQNAVIIICALLVLGIGTLRVILGPPTSQEDE